MGVPLYRIKNIINDFSGEYDFLSMDYPVEFNAYGYSWKSIREAYNAMSVELKIEDNQERMLNLMQKLIYYRFIQKDKEKLLETGTDWLCQLVKNHDNFWNNCTCLTCYTNDENNYYGKLLMEVRERFKWEKRRSNGSYKKWKSRFF